MSKIEVDQVDPQSGTTLTLGTSGDTISIPAGVTLANAGTATGFASIAWQSTIVTGATHTASANQGIWIDTTSNGCTLTLPGSPSVGDQLIFSDFARQWANNAVTLSLNGSKFQGNTSPAPVYDTAGETVHIVYSGSTQGWIPINDGAVALETPQTYTARFLVIGGGGGSAMVYGGGGGAGGYRNSFGSETSGRGSSTESPLSFTPGTVYTITVGGGGIGAQNYGGSAPGDQGINGDDSSISGSGITTITSLGGGGGAKNLAQGKTGGCGGGTGSNNSNPGAGTANQGYDSGSAGSGSGGYSGTGGGGAGAASASVGNTAMTGSDGGVGLQSSITGSAVLRGGGGGGGAPGSGTVGSGGSGGGGTNAAGTANTGGGGGATKTSVPAATSAFPGGSGVVILSMADADYSGTTTGSPTVATGVSGQTVLTFTGNGSYTG